jgi:hypothetical protein
MEDRSPPIVPLNEAEQYTLLKLEQTRLIEAIRRNTDAVDEIYNRAFPTANNVDMVVEDNTTR